MKRLILALCLLLIASVVYAGTTVTLVWNANTEVDLKGYRIYQDGTLQAPDIICPANDSSCCIWTSGTLTEGEHSWYATAFDGNGNESEPSDVVSYTVDTTAPGAPQDINITINLKVTVNPQ